jgi:type II restriction enzyme
MGLNLDKPKKWKDDILKSVDMYNAWFMNFAPEAFKSAREKTTVDVIEAFHKINYFHNMTAEILIANPEVLPTLRMSTCPPLAIDRLIGLSGVNSNLIKSIEKYKKLPIRMSEADIKIEIQKICDILFRLLDKDIFPWLNSPAQDIDSEDSERAAMIIADRLCGSVTNPIIRNAQEKRQLNLIKNWLEKQGFSQIDENQKLTIHDLKPGTFAFHFNVPVKMDVSTGFINIPVDAIIQPFYRSQGNYPILIEAKSAGDFTNTNKRRKEEAQKMMQLRQTYGDSIQFVLFLCGYFDSGYLGYEAAEGIDWVWEHSIDDLAFFLEK